MLFIFYFHYSIAFTPLLYAYPTEIFPYALHSFGVPLTYFSSHIGLIVSQFVNPIAMAALPWKYYIVFCVLNAVLFIVVWGFFPETKGWSLEEVGRMFDGDKDKVGERNTIPSFLEQDDIKTKDVQIEEVV